MNMSHQNKTIAVAMSGGVDSSVAAALLQQRGFHVFGMTMIHYDSVCAKAYRAAKDAEKVCRQLGIEHLVVDLREAFQQQVIDDFIREYLAGRTPNPCVRCNRTIKWGELLNHARHCGADMLATGHYVKLDYDGEAQRYRLLRSRNRQKDQSYALWRLTQEQLSQTVFPLEELNKDQVRELARKAGLDIAHKAESQDVCFIPDDDYKRFLIDTLHARGQTIEPGEIVDKNGQVLGTHQGYPFYTIGQRRGLGIALGRPVFVVDIDAENNRITVGDKEDLLSPGFCAHETNWVSTSRPDPGTTVTAHIRYSDPGFKATLDEVTDNNVKVRFEQPRLSVTPGQSAVFYDGDVLLGGGVINKKIKE